MSHRNKGRKNKHCPTPSKPCYTNEHFARLALEDVRYRDPREDVLNTRERANAYPCQCGKWHLTSKPTSRLKKNR